MIVNNLEFKKNSIFDDYVIFKDVVGVGISGKVLKCKCRKTDKIYALKSLKDTDKARREIELQSMASIDCDYIVKIIEVYENLINDKKVLLILMEYMSGGELFYRITENHHKFNEQEVAKIMFQICSAVKHLHSMNIAHRDLKPENLLLQSNEENSIIKLTDFGFAKQVSLGLKTPCFTPYYVAPEILKAKMNMINTYDISCDIWSLGVIMYILCSGYPPFYSTNNKITPRMKRRILHGQYSFPEREWEKISKEAKRLISGMLETDPMKRLTINEVMKSEWITVSFRFYFVILYFIYDAEILFYYTFLEILQSTKYSNRKHENIKRNTRGFIRFKT
jgi:mitogen-activated protein kinase-activated protein kinase 2